MSHKRTGSLVGFLSDKLKRRRSQVVESEQQQHVPASDTPTSTVPPESTHAAMMNGDGSVAGSESGPGPGPGPGSGYLPGKPDGDNNNHEIPESSKGNGNNNINSNREPEGSLLKRQRARMTPVDMDGGDGVVNGDRDRNGDGVRRVNHGRHHSVSSTDQDLDIQLEHPHRGINGGGSRASLVDIFEGPAISTAAAASLTRPSREDSPRRVPRLSSLKIQELTASPDSVPYRTVPFEPVQVQGQRDVLDGSEQVDGGRQTTDTPATIARGGKDSHHHHLDEPPELMSPSPFPSSSRQPNAASSRGRHPAPRTVSTPNSIRRQMMPPSSNSERLSQTWILRSKHDRSGGGSNRIDLDLKNHHHQQHLAPSSQQQMADPLPSPMPSSIPLPPLSIPTYLQLELASGRPSPLYIHRSVPSDFPYESSRVKLERLVNFLMLPPALEQVLWFGALACLDSWLYSFTILPLRFVKAVYILLESWVVNLGVEFRYISKFIIKGVGRVWRRRGRAQSSTGTESENRSRTVSGSSSTKPETAGAVDRDGRNKSIEPGRRHRRSETHKHRRQKSIPSTLLPDDKADILKGLLMIATCSVLMFFDASRMYHWIRGQAAIKLYVIYNVLEVSDRLFAALGQDVLECLFSREALERKPDGRSKVFRPFWLFLLALAYTVIHATALFYQVMTLNVAVNSYSNALITLLLSNQFVEIKSTVFKKFEKENLFQLTCADVVERFQLWLMLTIIALRNIVETGAFDIFGSLGSSFGNSNSSTSTNSTPLSTPPRTATSILPKSFTIFPSSLFSSLSGGANSFLPTLAQVLGPFLIVLGSEMLVDWLKHAYINKFNNTRPALYGRFLDILAKDYYTNAFADQNLTRRLGLPVIPLSCLFFRVSVQTYQMFLASLLPHPPPSSSTAVEAPSLSSIHDSHSHSQYFSSPSPSPGGAMFTTSSSSSPLSLIKTIIPTSAAHVSALFRAILANAMPTPARSVQIFTVILVITGFIALLILKLILGMLLLNFSRVRYRVMKDREVEIEFDHQRHLPSTSTSTNTTTNNNSSNNNNESSTVLPTPVPAPSTPAGNTTGPATPRHRGYAVDGSRRVGGWGVVEVNDDKRRWIYVDDPEGLRRLKEKEDKDKEKEKGKGGKDSNHPAAVVGSMEHVSRYEMVAKRIW